jgi:hypothetical protein
MARIIKEMFKKQSEYTPTPEDIISETAKYISISPEEIKSQRRTRNTAQARHISMYLIRTLTTFSLNDIGEFYDGRDHSTVLSSIRKVERDIKSSSELAQTVKDITANSIPETDAFFHRSGANPVNSALKNGEKETAEITFPFFSTKQRGTVFRENRAPRDVST